MATHVDPAHALEAMLRESVAMFDESRAAVALRHVRALRGFIDQYEAQVTTQMRALHERGESAPAADLHTRHGGISAKEAQRRERRAKALDRAPEMADALANGSIGAEHADALANATSGADDEVTASFFDLDADLATDAASMTPTEFAKNCREVIRSLERDQGIERAERQRRETRLTTSVDREGMYVLNARLHPELGSAVFNAIDAETAALVKAGGDRTVDRAHVRASALGNLVTGGHQAKRPVEAEIRVHVDEQTVMSGTVRPDSVCELDDGTPLPPRSVVRMLCNGTVVPILIGGDGVALNVGRGQRMANRAQRRALRAMYRSCAFHGCDVAFNRCEIHHLQPWELGGSTDLDNLLPLCSRHHHVVHDDGWSLELASDRRLTIRQRDGSVFAVVELPSRSSKRSRSSAAGHRPGAPPGEPHGAPTASEPDQRQPAA